MKLALLCEDMDAKLNDLTKILLGKKSSWLRRKLHEAKVQSDPTHAQHGIPEIPPELMQTLQQQAATDIKNAAQWDPTTRRELDGKYMQFIVRDIANMKIRFPEDGPPLKDALDTFSKGSKKGSWTEKKDIMQFPDWRELQRAATSWAEKNQDEGSTPSSETEWVKRAKMGADKIVEFNMTTTGGKEPGLKHYVIMQLNTPISVTVYGRGTQWCTSCSLYKNIRPSELQDVLNNLVSRQGETVEGDPWAKLDRNGFLNVVKELNGGDLTKAELRVPHPYYRSAISTAGSYLRGGPMFIIFKNGKPYIQMTNNGSQIMNANDVTLRTTSPALALMFRKMLASGKMSAEMTRVLEQHIANSGLKELEDKGLVPKI